MTVHVCSGRTRRNADHVMGQAVWVPRPRSSPSRRARSTSIHETDVLVVGSGPAGLAAALAAARAGVDVTLVERFGCFGGNITAVGVEGMAWYRHEQTVEADGIGREFEDARARDGRRRAARASRCRTSSTPRASSSSPTAGRGGRHPRRCSTALFVAPIMDGDAITGIITESKAGREAIRARRVIDATGDADVAHRAGAPTHQDAGRGR